MNCTKPMNFTLCLTGQDCYDKERSTFYNYNVNYQVTQLLLFILADFYPKPGCSFRFRFVSGKVSDLFVNLKHKIYLQNKSKVQRSFSRSDVTVSDCTNSDKVFIHTMSGGFQTFTEWR